MIYIFAMMLKDEIDKLENINQLDNFLNNTKCGYLIEELKQVPDIQMYFNKVILKAVEKLEKSFSSKEINFNYFESFNEFTILNEGTEKLDKDNYKNISKTKYPIDLDKNNSKEDNCRKTPEFNKNYFDKKYFQDLTIKEIEDYKKKAKKENKYNLYEYYNKLEEDCEDNNNKILYSNSTLMKKINENKSPTLLLSDYQKNLIQVISFIEQLLEDLIKNILLIPNSIRLISKIICILIKKKFKDISILEQNIFISKFIVEKLLIPFILSPNFNAHISDFYISENSIKNLKTICNIIQIFFSGKLFLNNSTEGNYTPFNRFFIEKMENIVFFFEKAINVNLPSFIEKFINDKLPKDYTYNYFDENKEKICADISICFNYSNLIYLIKGLSKCKNFIFLNNNSEQMTLKKTFYRLKNMMENDNLKNTLEKNYEYDYKYKEKKLKIEDIYFFYHNLEFEKTYKNLFIINNKISNYYIDIIRNENENQKNIIKAKNYLCGTL